LARRLVAATQWARAQPGFQSLNLGYFGASTGRQSSGCYESRGYGRDRRSRFAGRSPRSRGPISSRGPSPNVADRGRRRPCGRRAQSRGIGEDERAARTGDHPRCDPLV
jgi:hypothetical protein